MVELVLGLAALPVLVASLYLLLLTLCSARRAPTAIADGTS